MSARTGSPPVTLGTCPACGAELASTLACTTCGRLLEEPAGATLFARLGAPPSARIDAAALEQRYLRLSRALHPDFHGGAADALLDLAQRNSAKLNEAWTTLNDDQLRAEYLLSLHDPEALERGKQLPPAFLMQAMELSEAVEEAARDGDRAALARLGAGVRAEIDARRARVTDPRAWEPPDAQALARLLHEWRVFARILRDCERAR